MNESQRAMHRLIEEVVSLSEGTRFLAGSDGYQSEALQVVKACVEAVQGAVSGLDEAMADGSVEPIDDPRESAEVSIGAAREESGRGAALVEGLDELFGPRA